MKPCECVQTNILFTGSKTEGVNDCIRHIVLRTTFCKMVESSIDSSGYQVCKLHKHTIVGTHRNYGLNAGPSIELFGVTPLHRLLQVTTGNLIQ